MAAPLILFTSPFAAARTVICPSTSDTSPAGAAAAAAAAADGGTPPSVKNSPVMPHIHRLSTDLRAAMPTTTAPHDPSGLHRVRRMGSTLDSGSSKQRGSIGSTWSHIGGECGMRESAQRGREADERASESADPLAIHLSTVVQHSIDLATPDLFQPSAPPSDTSPSDAPPKPASLRLDDDDNPFALPSVPVAASSMANSVSSRSSRPDDAFDASLRQRPSVSSLDSSSSMQSCSSSDGYSALFSQVSESDDDDSDKTAVVDDDDEEAALRKTLSTWAFDANALPSATIRACPRALLMGFLQRTPGLIAQLSSLGVADPVASLESLCASFEGAYHARNSYHNFRHAVDVTQAVYAMLVSEGVAPPLTRSASRPWKRAAVGRIGHVLSDLEVFALLLAAQSHDVGHPGLSNAYLINAHAPLTKVFGKKAALENFHVSTFRRMLRAHGFGCLLRPTSTFHDIVTESILATDMGQHFEVVGKLKALASEWHDQAPDPVPLQDKLLLTIGIMKCADISNPTRPHHIARSWSSCLLDEWAQQARLEADLKLPVSVVVLDPTEQKAQAKSQVGFIDLFVKPLFEAMESISSGLEPFAQACRDGRETWQRVADDLARREAPPPVIAPPRKASVMTLTLAERRCLKRGALAAVEESSRATDPRDEAADDEQSTPRPPEQARWLSDTPKRAGPSPRSSPRRTPSKLPMPTPFSGNKNPFATSWAPPTPSGLSPFRIALPSRACSISLGPATGAPTSSSVTKSTFFLPRASISVAPTVTPSPEPSPRPAYNKSESDDGAGFKAVKGCGGKCGGVTTKCGACAAAEAEERAEEEKTWAASRAWSLAWPPPAFRPT